MARGARSKFWPLGVGAAWLAVVCLAASLSALAATTGRVNVSGTGEQADDESCRTAISADGRYVAFTSRAGNLVPGDTNGGVDVFIYDRIAGIVERVSVTSAGQEAHPSTDYCVQDTPAVSADGRYVAFASGAPDLVPGDTNGAADVLVRDRITDLLLRASVTVTGVEANGPSEWPAISADGRYVAFHSWASNLVPGDTNGLPGQDRPDVFVRDLLTGVTERISVSSMGTEGDDSSYSPAISADGRYIAFVSMAANLVRGDTNDRADIFVRDRIAGDIERVSVSTEGAQADGYSSQPAISADGRYVAFGSHASNLVPGDTNQESGDGGDIFVHDRVTGITERVSVSSSGEQANYYSLYPALSADGRYVVFESDASNLVPSDTNESPQSGWDVFVRDRALGTTERVSVNSAGEQSNYHNYCIPAISANGRYISFASYASNLVPGDTNGQTDIFLRTRDAAPDVSTSYWAYSQIAACMDAGIVKGYKDGTYQPTGTVTRGQMAAYVARAMCEGEENVPTGPATPTFSDVGPENGFYRHIEYAVAQGVVTGYAFDNTYRPEELLNRGQMAAFLARAKCGGEAGVPAYAGAPSFPDVAQDFKFYSHVEYIYSQGITTGKADGLYHPEEACLRDQMAVFVGRAFLGLP